MHREHYDVWAVVKDIGGINAMLPIVDRLEKSAVRVLLIANGKAAEMLNPQHRNFVVAVKAERLLQRYKSSPKVLLTSMCDGGGVGRDLVPLLRGKSTIVAVQDFWGGYLRTSWADEAYRPDYLCVNDDYAKKIVLDAWQDMNPGQVWTCGNATFDKYASMDVEAENTKVRDALGLGELPIVLFAGQWQGTGEVLDSVVDALNELDRGCYLLPRMHPKMKDFPDEFIPWQRALSKFRGHTIVDWFGNCTMPSLIAACTKRRGVVVSMFSTTLIEAGALKAPAVSAMFPEFEAKYYRPDQPFDLPITALDCAAKVTSQQQLLDTLESALSGKLGFESAQGRHIKTDGHNASRCAQKIIALL